jgi:hypothetical protein
MVNEVLSPRWASAKTGIFEVFPSLSYEDDNVSDEESVDLSSDPDNLNSGEVTQVLKEFRSRFARLKLKWTKAFQDIEGSHLLVTSDIQKLASVARNLLVSLGSPSTVDGHHFANLWDAVLQISQTLHQNIASTKDFVKDFLAKHDDLSDALFEIQSVKTEAVSSFSSIPDALAKHDSRFSKILPGGCYVLNHYQSQ